MVSLLVESFANSIKTERNLEPDSNIKKLMQKIIEPQVFNFFKISTIKDNIFFRDKNVDIMHSLPNTLNSNSVLRANGYKKIDMDDYTTSGYNTVFEVKNNGYVKNVLANFKTSLDLNYKGVNKTFSYFIDENFIIFYDIENHGNKYFYSIDQVYEVIDFKIDPENFVHLVFSYERETYYAKTHLYLPFAKINTNNCIFDEHYFLEKIKLGKSFESLYSIKNNFLYLYESDGGITSVELGKKYYFELDGIIYFSHSDVYDLVKNSIIEENIQINNLNMYNYISMLGLNNFRTINNLKISSLDEGVFTNIFKNRFSNTNNGGINYFNTKKIETKKDYHLNIKDDCFAIDGNFIFQEAKGDFEIEITKTHCRLYKVNAEDKVMVKEMKLYSRTFTFCNIKFEFLRFDSLIKPYVVKVSNKDSYPFGIVNDKAIKISKVFNDAKISKKTLSKAKLNGFYNHSVDSVFNGKAIVIKNFYDYNQKRYLFDNHQIKVERNSKINLTGIFDYKFIGPYTIKNGFIYFREDGLFTYTTMDTFKFPLINSLGYITSFWIENQGLDVYFKIENNQIITIDNYNDCDIMCRIPPIENFIVGSNKFTNIIIDDNNEYESEQDEDPSSLITEKFMNVPLFKMVYAENTDYIEIYTTDKKRVYNVITEPYNGGLIAYFDNLDETLYYNTRDTQFNYFTPIKSYENITNTFMFDENNEINFGATKTVKNFTLSSDKTFSGYDKINLILYNHEKEETYKLQLDSSEVGKVFELNLDVDSIFMEKNNNFNDIRFSFKITKINSIIQNGKITYLKSSVDNPVYASKLKDKDLKFEDYTKVKVDTKYEKMSNGTLRESYNGDISIRCPFPYELPVFKRDNFQFYYNNIDYCLASEFDEFYIKNFKTPGLLFRTPEEAFDISTSNNSFTLDEIIDKEHLGGNDE
ncbi:MAG: hypothetical protein ACRCXX_14250 [Cetobacterium sp.]|uniref:hypothetical protein n=1 Tax=Cetobacterium sp. TaxID=2071632 RepID=UPI003F2DFDB2